MITIVISLVAFTLYSGSSCSTEDDPKPDPDPNPGQTLSDARQILSFGFAAPPATGAIDQSALTIAVKVPSGTSVTALAPNITVSTDAKVSPASGSAQNFTNPVKYTVTSESGKTAVYTVTVTVDVVVAQQIELKSPINKSTTLRDLGLPIDYIFNGDELKVSDNATLTIEPGVAILFNKTGSYLNIDNGSTLSAVGTAEKHIQFVGSTTNKGSWRGVHFTLSTTDNVLDYVEILNAGSQDYDYSAALYLSNSKASITNCLIDRSKSNGVFVSGGSGGNTGGKGEFKVFSNNTISNCDYSPIYTGDYTGVYAFRNVSNNNSFPNNGKPYIQISDNGNMYLTEDVTLPSLNGYPWYLKGGIQIPMNIDLTIEPGAVIMIGNATTISMYASSHLIAEGTSDKHITFKGFTDKAGAWKCIEVNSSAAGTKVKYCDISNGGGESNSGMLYLAGNMLLENTTFSKSATYGIYNRYGQVTSSNPSSVTFSQCAEGNIYDYSSKKVFNDLLSSGIVK